MPRRSANQMRKIAIGIQIAIGIVLMGSGVIYGILVPVRIDSTIAHYEEEIITTISEHFMPSRDDEYFRDMELTREFRNVGGLADAARNGWFHLGSLSWISFISGILILSTTSLACLGKAEPAGAHNPGKRPGFSIDP